MAYVTKLRTIASKVEASAGTAETLTTADNNLRIMDLSIGSLDVPMDQSPSKYATGDMFNGAGIPGPQSVKIGGSIKLWSDGPTTKPAWTKWTESCGALTSSAAGGYEIYPATSAIGTSLTMGIYDKEAVSSPQAIKFEVIGAMGDCTLKADGVGKPIVATFDFTGGLNDISDIALTAVPAFSASSQVIPDRFLGGYVSVSGVSACVSTFEFKFGNSVTPIECVGTESGYLQYIITEMNPTLTINPLLTRTSTFDFWDNFVTGKVYAIVLSTDMFTITIPQAQCQTAGVSDRSGIIETPLTFNCLRSNVAGSYAYAPWVIKMK